MKCRSAYPWVFTECDGCRNIMSPAGEIILDSASGIMTDKRSDWMMMTAAPQMKDALRQARDFIKANTDSADNWEILMLVDTAIDNTCLPTLASLRGIMKEGI